MDENMKWWGEQALEQTVKALQKHGMEAAWVADSQEARHRVLEMIPAGGFGRHRGIHNGSPNRAAISLAGVGIHSLSALAAEYH